MLAALTLALALPARAELAVYDAGRDPGQGIVWSADGYHYAFYESSDGEDRWVVDGKVRARGPEGTLGGGAALSRDGRILLHQTAVFDDKGRPLGLAAAVNGRRAGSPFEELAAPAISPNATNVAYAAKTARGWVVRSQQGEGPALAELPLALEVSEKETAYFAAEGGGARLYRNHKPGPLKPYQQAAIAPGLARSGGVYQTPAPEEAIRVEVDGTAYGPYALASVPAFSADGRHFAFLAAGPESQGNSYDLLIVDGVERPMHRCAGCTVTVDARGRAFQDLVLTAIGERAQIHAAFLDGKSLGGQPPKVGFSPGGAHFVYPMLANRGPAVGLDGALTESGAPLPLPPAPVEFDGTDEYHYWSVDGKRLRLVCGSAAGPRAPKTRCEGVARRAGWPRS